MRISDEIIAKLSKIKDYPEGVDKDASWLKKQGKYRYGYKKHYVTDQEGLVLGVVTILTK